MAFVDLRYPWCRGDGWISPPVVAVALGWAMRRKPFSRFNEYVGSASNTCWFARALELRTLLIR
ncbi:hypothetical protein DSI35_05120 [Mycobacterium tuberculosis]|uniref:Uncharacterized protein n=12 Tax=Mycobacterium tuberculosis complex TaxID=77643 RepID=Q8VJM8_MYCTO|nr:MULTISPECIES: hypothetical protein [Mycobacterium]YP_177665.1 hypothetical protein Rv2307A [Mycobacterium tuberculosis H37Rv]EAY60518.1 hypothetical glycine rich protein [Mycobacterium tuberculosis C]EFP54276.1 hypothetical glycine rich protein [Mycobacterium tuberculosis SUMu012]EPZ65347.1 putative glycine rich protein [Mycobacterium tuberculosis '98-R604 INH-RIF-EM']KAK26481.1 hypothetical protein AZ55_13735 [Mycobacterium tuberculosis CWCFVRF MDRTB 670]KAM28701.1 glycine rich protein [M